ncbi:MAG: lipopolysaccharide assembly LapA domain-containing protein [Thermodesulfobacteriota bacterium]
MPLFLILALLVAIAAVVFALQNITPVTITFFLWQYAGSLALILLLALGLGVLITILASIPATLKRRMEITSQKKTIEQLERELQEKGGPSSPAPPEEGG